MKNRKQFYKVEQKSCFKRARGVFSSMWIEKGLICVQHSAGFRMAADYL